MAAVKPDDIKDHIGTETGVGDWIEVSQERINDFADVTEDHQFIHIDKEKAAQTPFGGTIAHGLLTLSLLPKLAAGQMLAIEGVVMGINYGFDKVRFLNPVPSGSRVRGRFKLIDAVEKSPGRWLTTSEVTVEIEGVDKPALVATWLGMQVVG